MILFSLPGGLYDLRQIFRNNGFDIRLVGGCVRDALAAPSGGITTHDIDLCTDATPEEQRAIYRHYGIRHINTGAQHGTWTVLLDQQRFQITTLRQHIAPASDQPGDQPGHHPGNQPGDPSGHSAEAGMAFTDCWERDLARRDLTINAMSASFEGLLYDPHGGAADLAAGIVRFVGDAEQRIAEDYLRILRWFRFHARFGQNRFVCHDVLTERAVHRHRAGLRQVSRERVWAELKAILADPNGLLEIVQMLRLDIAPQIDLPLPRYGDQAISFIRLERAHRLTRDPVSLLAAYLGSVGYFDQVAQAWHLSKLECAQGQVICHLLASSEAEPLRCAQYLAAHDDIPKPWLVEALAVRGEIVSARVLRHWEVPAFPLRGQDLIDHGIPAGPTVGRILQTLRKLWADSHFTLGRDDLLRTVS